MKKYLFLLGIFELLAVLLLSQCTNPFIPDAIQITTMSTRLGDGEKTILSKYSEWSPHVIYSSFGYVSLDSTSANFVSIHETRLRTGNSLKLNIKRNRLLFTSIPPNDNEYYKVGLTELNLQTLQNQVIIGIEGGEIISSAVYNPLNDDEVILHSYGTCTGYYDCSLESKIYLYNRKTRIRTLILDLMDKEDSSQLFNDIRFNNPKGFDIHPQGNILLIPITAFKKRPIILQYHLITHKLDTLNIQLPISNTERKKLWLRYNSDGSKILYCYSPENTAFPVEPSEIAIVSLSSYEKKLLNTRTSQKEKTLDLYPVWSPNDQYILYSSAQAFQTAANGTQLASSAFFLFILKI